MFIKRALAQRLYTAIEFFPSIMVSGPRQSGKTTLLKHEFPDAHYVTFDDLVQRQFASEDPRGFLDQFSGEQTILDEIQFVPELLSYIKMDIDSRPDKSGRWLMTGSQQFSVMKNLSDSLAGRVGVFSLLPFSYLEIEHHKSNEIQSLLWNGLYPKPYLNAEFRTDWLSSYIKTYIERDVRQIISVEDLLQFQQFFTLIAARHGSEINMSAISRDCGVSVQTIKRWISILEASYTTFLLRPFHANIKKRLIKAPKIYFYDAAIAAYLTQHQSAEGLYNGPMAGEFFEGFIISEIMKLSYIKNKFPAIYYLRTVDGLEIDLIFEYADKIIPVEIKKTATPTRKHADNIHKYMKIVQGKQCSEGFVVCTIDKSVSLSPTVKALPWSEFLNTATLL